MAYHQESSERLGDALNQPVLEVRRLKKAFGGLMAVSEVSFQIPGRSIKALIGPNGAGKTTIFNIITGLLSATSGEVYFQGRPITGMKPHRIAELGIARTFQNVQLFGNMTVLENVMVGCHCHMTTGIVAAALRLPKAIREERWVAERSEEILARVGLKGKGGLMASSLPFGEQRLLELARALAIEPKVLLLDEPAAGLNPIEKKRVGEVIQGIRGEGITVFLVDHSMDLVMDISDAVMVIHYGEKIAEGTPREITSDAGVIAAYLGEDEADQPALPTESGGAGA